MKSNPKKLTIILIIFLLLITGVVAVVLFNVKRTDKEKEGTTVSEENSSTKDEDSSDGGLSTIKVDGTNLNVSYRLLNDDEFSRYENDSIVFHESSNGNGNAKYMVSFSEDIKTIIFCKIGSYVNEEGELSVFEKSGVEIEENIKANENVIFCAEYVGEKVSSSGIRVFDNSGNEYHFYLQLSEEDGSPILRQYDYSFFNIQWNEIYDDMRAPAHLSGFQNIDEALAYYDMQDYMPTWKVLWVVIDTIDADCVDREGNSFHHKISMSKEEEDFYLNDMSKQFADSVYELSNQSISIDMDTLLYTKPINYLEEDCNSILPDSFDDETIEKFKQYNSVICTVRLNEEDDDSLPVDWIGIAWGIFCKSYGFCEVEVAHFYEENRYSDYPYHAEPWIHEWIHTLEPVGLIFDTTIASADGATDHGYPCEDNGLGINGFYKYYADILTANVKNTTGENEGFTKGMWRTMSAVFEKIKEQISS